MAKKVINVGTTANDATGDSLRVAGVKINDNFTEIYNALGGGSGAPLTIVSKVTAGNGITVSSPTGEILITNKIASQNEIGGIKVGTGINLTEDGTASVQVYSLPKASQTILGGVKVGAYLDIDANGVLSANPIPYTLPTATNTVLGGVKVGSGLNISNGVLSAAVQEIPVASTTVLGGVKVDGSTITINNGVISGANTYVLPTATGSVLGGVKIGTGLTVTDGVLSVEGGAGASRIAFEVTTTSIGNEDTDNVIVYGFKSYMLMRVNVSHASWIRIYDSQSSLMADSSRDILTDPAPGSGVLAEFITQGPQIISVTPAVLGFVDDGEAIPNAIPVAITNKSGSTATITVTFMLLQLEI